MHDITRAERASGWIFRLLLLAIVMAAPWPFGSVTPRPAAWLAAALIGLGGLYVGTRIYWRRIRRLPGWRWLAGAIVLIGLQLVPVPLRWLDNVAPSAHNFYASLASVVETSGWHPMSAEPFQTRWGVIQFVSLISAFYLSTNLFRHGRERRLLVYGITLVGIAVALFAVYQKARFGTVLYGKFPVPSASPFGPFVSHNHFAGFVQACALTSLGAAVGTATRKPSLAVLLGGASALMGISIVLSQSRGGWIAATSGVVVLVVLSRTDHARARRWVLIGTAAAALFLAAFAPSSLTERMSTFGALGDDVSVRFRIQLWSDSSGMIAGSPMVGSGLGTYAAVIPAYRTGVDETRAEHAESDWLQLVSELGLVGLALAIGFLATIGRRALSTIENETSLRSRGVLLGALAAITAFLAHGLYDFNFHIPSNALLFAVLLGLVASGDDDEIGPWSSRWWFRVLVAPLAAATLTLTSFCLSIGESRALARGIDPVKTDAEEFTDTIQALVRSQRLVPQNPETAFLTGRLYNEEAYRARDAARYREARLEQARASFQESLRLGPARGRVWFELGWTEANLGNDTRANAFFERAIELEPQRSSIRANYASYLAARGRIDEALEQLERGRELVPGIPPLEAVNILAPFVGEDPILLRRAAGSGDEADQALERHRRFRALDDSE